MARIQWKHQKYRGQHNRLLLLTLHFVASLCCVDQLLIAHGLVSCGAKLHCSKKWREHLWSQFHTKSVKLRNQFHLLWYKWKWHHLQWRGRTRTRFYTWSQTGALTDSVLVTTGSMRQYPLTNQVVQVVQLLQDGTSVHGWRRYQETDHYTKRAGQGCRRATSQQQD